MDIVTEQPLNKDSGCREEKATLPVSLKQLESASEVTIKQHIDSAEGK